MIRRLAFSLCLVGASAAAGPFEDGGLLYQKGILPGGGPLVAQVMGSLSCLKASGFSTSSLRKGASAMPTGVRTKATSFVQEPLDSVVLAETRSVEREQVVGVVLDLDTEAKRRDRPVLTGKSLYRREFAFVLERQIVDIAASAKTIGYQGFDVRQEPFLPVFSNRPG